MDLKSMSISQNLTVLYHLACFEISYLTMISFNSFLLWFLHFLSPSCFVSLLSKPINQDPLPALWVKCFLVQMWMVAIVEHNGLPATVQPFKGMVKWLWHYWNLNLMSHSKMTKEGNKRLNFFCFSKSLTNLTRLCDWPLGTITHV